ncbi:MAG: hypothetical protein LBC53_03620 [Spirochaetaceae bacterium]|nr:hypothetical protein [Spirochaetaceae bacterium]
MKNLNLKDCVFAAFVLSAAVFAFNSCGSEVVTPETAKPITSVKVASLKVTPNFNIAQKFSDDPSDEGDVKGGWFEKNDAPDFVINSGDLYNDPKSLITVKKVLEDGRGEELALNDEFKVLVLDEKDAPQSGTKLTRLGDVKIKIVYALDASVPVKYYQAFDTNNLSKTNDDYFTIFVTETKTAVESSGKQLTGYTLFKKPNKLVYGWKEDFDISGMIVLAWYGGNTLNDGGLPLYGNPFVDYDVDFSAYNKMFEITLSTDGKPEEKAPESKPNIEIKIIPPATEAVNEDERVVAFYVDIELKTYNLEVRGSDGRAVTGGVVSFGAAKIQQGSPVQVDFKGNSGYQLNVDSVRLRYGGKEESPVYNDGVRTGAGFMLNGDEDDIKRFINDGRVVPAIFTMPSADVVIVADFLYGDTNLTAIEIATSEGKDAVFGTEAEQIPYKGIYGFNSNITYYTVVVNNATRKIGVDAKSTSDNLDVSFDLDFVNADLTTDTPNGGSYKATITDKGSGLGLDMLLKIVVGKKNENTQKRTYIVNIKRFNLSNEIQYNYTGDVQAFVPPFPGVYEFTAWGAHGGMAHAAAYGWAGWGGKTSGQMQMDPSSTESSSSFIRNQINTGTPPALNVVYVYVGEGGWARLGEIPGKATYNGGGAGGAGGAYGAGAGGGGATSVSLTRGRWSDWQVLIDRIMVAGGGGGSGHNDGRAGAAGLEAMGGRTHATDTFTINDANSATGYLGTSVKNGYWNGATNLVGSGRGGQGFGIGGTGPAPPGWGSCGAEGRGGGGGGYFGGEISWGKTGTNSNAGGGGGSSYVSGFKSSSEKRCISYDPKSTATWLVPMGKNSPSDGNNFATEVEKHYSGYVFNNPYVSQIVQGDSVTGGYDGSGDATLAKDPFNGGRGSEGQKNRDGILVIKYLGDPTSSENVHNSQ